MHLTGGDLGLGVGVGAGRSCPAPPRGPARAPRSPARAPAGSGRAPAGPPPARRGRGSGSARSRRSRSGSGSARPPPRRCSAGSSAARRTGHAPARRSGRPWRVNSALVSEVLSPSPNGPRSKTAASATIAARSPSAPEHRHRWTSKPGLPALRLHPRQRSDPRRRLRAVRLQCRNSSARPAAWVMGVSLYKLAPTLIEVSF